MSTHSCDVLVIGGGPGGSTAGALLARSGRHTVVIEKAIHPRFHIGESLLPANMPLFEELGVREQVAAIGLPKWGVEFVSPTHDHATALRFTDAWDKSLAAAVQVRRSALDQLLLRNAGRLGAHVFEGHQVRSVAFRPHFGGARVAVTAPGGELQHWDARIVIDASGRDTVLGSQFKVKAKHPGHASAAIFGHFRGARRHPGDREGDISIFWFQHGWFWFIPLADGTTSVGAVCWPRYLKQRDRPLAAFLADTIRLCPRLEERLGGAVLEGDVHATGNYSYCCERPHGAADRASYLLVGDAFTFVDPVFSSGVFLAMSGAFMAAEAVGEGLARPQDWSAAMKRYERRMSRGPREFSWFIERMTQPGIREMFMAPRNLLGARAAVVSVLAGDLYRDTRYRPSLWVFKAMYYLNLLRRPVRSLRSWRQRRFNIQDAPFPG